MGASRKFKESPMEQGEDEKFAYKLDTSNWPGTGDPTSPVVVIKDADLEDVSGTHLSGSTSVSGDIITTPLVVVLVPTVTYRFEIKWVKSGNTLEAYGPITGTI